MTDRDRSSRLPRHETAWRIFQNDGGQWLGKTSPGPPLTYLLVERAVVLEDGGRNHDAPLDHFVLCDTDLNCSWSWCKEMPRTFFQRRRIRTYQCHRWIRNHTRVNGSTFFFTKRVRSHIRTSSCVKTTPQMTRFRDVKVCNNLVTDEIDDYRIQSDCKCTIGLQYPEGKNSTLGIAYAW